MATVSQTSSLTFNGAALDGYSAGSASLTSDPFYLGNVKGYSLMFVCPATGTPVGTVSVQCCNDKERNNATGMPGGSLDANLANWNTIPFTNSSGSTVTSVAVSSATTINIDDSDAMYRWLRLVYTATSGTVLITAHIQIKAW